MTRLTINLSLLAIALVAGCDAPDSGTSTHPGSDPVNLAAVAMPDSESARVAADILRAGGNAVDAAVAAEFVLAVTLPEAGNIGGGGFMLMYFENEPYFLDYRETAPLAAHRDMYLDEGGDVIRGASIVGHLAVGVPGSVAGMWEAHRRFGTLPWRDVVMPAVLLARDGFVVHPELADNVGRKLRTYRGKTNFEDYFGDVQAGTIFRQPELAETLERIAADGADGFYRGRTAELLVADMAANDGLITHEDLERYRAIWREPLRADWRDFEILAAPPPSSGGFAVIQLLKMKDLLSHEFDDVPHNSARYVHLFAEMQKRVFADRAEYLGDPDYFDVPLNELLSDEYLRRRAAEVKPGAISTIDEVRPGLESMETTHYSIVDGDGNAVSTTTTLNLSFGSGVVVEGAGFLLNDEMDDFSVKPGVQNAYGVVGNIANEIQPGKRMLSSMSPTIVLRDGNVDYVTGTPGGTTIFTTVFQMIVNNYDFGMDPLQSAGAPRFHHQLPQAKIITYSPTVPLPEETISQLSEIGYRTIPHPYDYGDVQTIYRRGTEWLAASDPRKRGESRVIEISPEEPGGD